MDDQLAELEAESPGPSHRSSPCPESGLAPSSWLQVTRRCVQKRLEILDLQPVCVLAVQRYLGEIGRCRYYYDITLYDGVVQDTWLLSPELGHLVHRLRLHSGSRVTITKCSYRYMERSLSGGLVCIEEMEVGEDMEEDVPPVGEMTPLCGGRKHYMPLWNNDDPYGDIWDRGQETVYGSIDVSKRGLLQNLETRGWSNMHRPPLLVVIMHKSRLRYFGKVDQKVEYPYHAYFEVADHSGMMSMVMWNYLCLEWYNKLRIGNVLLIQQYDLKKSYQKRTLPTTCNTQVKRLPNIEISLNVRDPAAKISVLRKEDVKPEWRLPCVKYNFVTRSQLSSLPHNQVCDVIGLVTFVGRCERKRIPRERKRIPDKDDDEGEDFWLYRWVHVTDGTSDQPLLLEIFATSQPNIFGKIHPMTYLVCTQMRVVRNYPEDASSHPYLTTSNESQVFITNGHKGQPYTNDEKVKDFIKWMKTQHEANFKRRIAIGGYHPYPQPPETFAKYCGDNKVEKVLTPIGEVKSLVEQLHYREHTRVAIQGIIAACRFVENEEIGNVDSEAQNEEPASFSSVSHGNTGMDSDAQGKKRSVVVSSLSSHEDASHCETSNVTLVKRRRTHAEDLSEIASQSVHNVEAERIPTSLLSEGDEGSHSSIVESEKSDGTWPPGKYWESALWSEIKHRNIERLQYSTVFPESLPRKFNYNHKEFLIQQYNLHLAKHEKSTCTSKLKVQDLPCASVPGRYEFTILGLNHDLAIDVSLPVYENFRLLGPNCLPNHMYCLNVDWNAETQDRHWLSLKEELVEYSSSQDTLHIICILDLCYLEDGKVEIFLNRVYQPTDEEKQ